MPLQEERCDSIATASSDQNLRLDYEQTVQYHHQLADIRFRLLSLVPLSTGAALVLVEKSVTGPVVLVVGLLGFIVTLGITFYDQRNTQIYNAMQRRAKALEVSLGFPSVGRAKMKQGGPFLDRPHRDRRLFGLLMWHDRAIAIIYAGAFAGWSYLIVDGLIQALTKSPQWYLAVTRLIFPMFVFSTFVRKLSKLDEPTDLGESAPE